MDFHKIDAAVAALDELALVCACGDGDSANMAIDGEDALLFDVLKAIARGADNPQDIAAHVILACATTLQGRCHADAMGAVGLRT
jgi:hypothetical protein